MNELCLLSNLSSSEWASWVQAVGSIAAIVASARIVRWQLEKQLADQLFVHEKQRVERNREVQERAASIIHHTANTLAEALEGSDVVKFLACIGQPHWMTALHLLVPAIETISYQDMPSPKALMGLLSAKRAAGVAISNVQDLAIGRGMSADVIAERLTAIKPLLNTLRSEASLLEMLAKIK